MKKIAFYDTKPYDRVWMDRLSGEYGFNIKYFESKLNADTVSLANGFDGVVAFVNDDIGAPVLNALYGFGIRILALRSAGITTWI